MYAVLIERRAQCKYGATPYRARVCLGNRLPKSVMRRSHFMATGDISRAVIIRLKLGRFLLSQVFIKLHTNYFTSVAPNMADRIVFVVFLVYLFGCLEATKTASTKKLVIDHDGGADDAFAITLSLLNEKYFDGPKLIALTTTFGNVDLNQTIINSDRILALVDRQDVPIYPGAHHALISDLQSDHFYDFDGLGDDGYKPSAPIKVQDKAAAVALIELSEIYEGELIIAAIGPMTNIALAAIMDPKFIGRLAQLYVGAGHIYSETHPKPEFNANMDPEAYHIMADSALLDKVTFVAFSQIHLTLNASLDWRKNLLGKIETPLMEALNGFERISLTKNDSWKKLDPAVAAIALDNDLVEVFRNVSNDINLEGDKRGINTNDFSSTNPNGRVVYAANKESTRNTCWIFILLN